MRCVFPREYKLEEGIGRYLIRPCQYTPVQLCTSRVTSVVLILGAFHEVPSNLLQSRFLITYFCVNFFFIFSHCLIALSGMLCVNRANSDITCVVHIMIPLTDAKAREVYSTGQNVYVPAPQVCEVRITS